LHVSGNRRGVWWRSSAQKGTLKGRHEAAEETRERYVQRGMALGVTKLLL
jgi:hypothetical protein